MVSQRGCPSPTSPRSRAANPSSDRVLHPAGFLLLLLQSKWYPFLTMARILPFPALRYNPARVRLADVVTQPYDKITAEMQERYYAASPHNLVRIILGKREPSDNGQNVYSRAAAAFSQWRKDAIFIQDPDPMLYAYAQEFAVPGSPEQRLERRGFIGLGQLEPYDAGVVFRHEQTHSGPKADRLNLLRATRAHFGQLFMLYNDPRRRDRRRPGQGGAPSRRRRDARRVRSPAPPLARPRAGGVHPPPHGEHQADHRRRPSPL